MCSRFPVQFIQDDSCQPFLLRRGLLQKVLQRFVQKLMVVEDLRFVRKFADIAECLPQNLCHPFPRKVIPDMPDRSIIKLFIPRLEELGFLCRRVLILNHLHIHAHGR